MTALTMAVAAPQEDYDLQQAWQDVLQAFAKQTKLDLQSDRVLTPEDVIGQLKLKRDKEDADNAKYADVRRVLGRSLACIQTLGGIAAQGAGVVFGPADLCFNAISFFITAGQNYNGIFSNLEILFKEMSEVLHRFVVYLEQKEVDKDLRKILHELLQSIISICTLSHKVLHRSKRSQSLKFFKVLLFSEDDGVKAELLKLRKLVDQELQMKTTLIYKTATETREAVSEANSSLKKLTDGTALKKIKEKLGIQKQAEKQSQSHARLRSETVGGIGEWLQKDDAHKFWSDRSMPNEKILFLRAKEGYGKTFLVSYVVSDLQRRYARQPDSTIRTTVAYYYLFPRDSKAAHSDSENLNSINTVFKTLAFQLAQDPVYLKDLSSLCEPAWVPEDNKELISNLLKPCYKSNEVFFLVIDGIDQVDDKNLEELPEILNHVHDNFTAEEREHVRILLSGRDDVIRNLTRSLRYPSTEIDVASKNRSDIEIFIRDRISSLKLLKGDSEQLRNLREEVFISLSENAKGDFVNVDLLLKEIETKQWPAEIREVLTTAESGIVRSGTIAREVARCNDSLSPQEIRDLNILLLWVISAKRTLTIKELNAALFLNNNDSSLRPLHEQIRDKYSIFFRIDEEENPEGANGYSVSLSSDSIEDHIKGNQVDEADMSAMTHKVQESEVKIVRRLLGAMCDTELYNKFGFEDLFKKLGSSTVRISVNLRDAPVTMLIGCLETMVSSVKELEALRGYAIKCWPVHLADTDLSMTIPEKKIEVGKYMLSLFTDEDIVSHWWIKPNIMFKDEWFFKDDYVNKVLTWLQDRAVTKSYTDEKKAWIETLISSTPHPDADLLQRVALFLARMLISDKFWQPRALYSTLQAFRTKLEHRKDTSVERLRKDLSIEDKVSSKQIQDLFTWAAEINKVDMNEDYVANRILANFFRVYGCYNEAIIQYKHAMTMSEDNWDAQWGLAYVYRELGESQLAIELLQAVIHKVDSGEAKRDDPSSKDVKCTLAGYYSEVKRFQEALTLYDEVLAANPTDYAVMYSKMQTLASQGEHQAIIDLLDNLHSQTDPTFGISMISRLVHTHMFDEEFGTLLIETGKKLNQGARLVAAYNKTIEDISKPSYLPERPSLKALCQMLLTQAVADEMWKLAKTIEKKEKVIYIWEKLVRDAKDEEHRYIRMLTGKRLVNVYADRLRELKDPDSKEAKEMVKKINNFAHAEQGSWESGVTIDSNFLLAGWHQSHGHDVEAMRLLRGTMKVGFDLLSDEDEENDWQGYCLLGTALMYYGDVENSLAAWSLVGPQNGEESMKDEGFKGNGSTQGSLEDGFNGTTTGDHTEHVEQPTNYILGELDDQQEKDDDEDKSDDQQEKDEGGGLTGFEYGCDGNCGHFWRSADDVYLCRDCLDVAFDEKCFKQLKAGELPENVCNPSHEFLHVPKWDKDEFAKRGKNRVKLRGENVPTKEWLRDLKKAWGFDVTSAE